MSYAPDDEENEYETAMLDAAEAPTADVDAQAEPVPAAEEKSAFSMQQLTPLIAVVAQAMARKQQEAEAKKRKRAAMVAGRGGSLGAPSYGYDAGNFNYQLSQQPGPDFMGAATQTGRGRR